MTRNRARLAMLAIAVLAALAPSTAMQRDVTAPLAVVELFTSQGCPSCPPADALLLELAQRGDVVALGYHVDYWDYIGWPDTFADPAFSDLQRAYSVALGKHRVYTPQMVIDGRHDVVGSRAGEVNARIGGTPLPVEVRLSAGDGTLHVEVPPDPSRPAGEATIWLVAFCDRQDVEIEHGENEGRTISYAQIVIRRQVLGMWDPADGAQFRLPLAEVLGEAGNGAAVLVQHDRHGLPGEVVGAASIMLPDGR